MVCGGRRGPVSFSHRPGCGPSIQRLFSATLMNSTGRLFLVRIGIYVVRRGRSHVIPHRLGRRDFSLSPHYSSTSLLLCAFRSDVSQESPFQSCPSFLVFSPARLFDSLRRFFFFLLRLFFILPYPSPPSRHGSMEVEGLGPVFADPDVFRVSCVRAPIPFLHAVHPIPKVHFLACSALFSLF